jgi:hypothetical protein
LMAEYELWPGFVRRCTKLTKLPSAEPSSDMISLACNRWHSFICLRYYTIHDTQKIYPSSSIPHSLTHHPHFPAKLVEWDTTLWIICPEISSVSGRGEKKRIAGCPLPPIRNMQLPRLSLFLLLRSNIYNTASAFKPAIGATSSASSRAVSSQISLANTSEMSTITDEQLFGRFKISSNQIFYRSSHSFAMVNLRPLLPGHVLVVSNRVVPLLSDLQCKFCTIRAFNFICFASW